MSLPGFFAAAARVLREAIRALKPYGAAPIVVVILACAGIAGLAAHGPQLATIAVVLIAFGFYYLTEERKSEWRRRDLEVEYDALERKDEAAVRRKLQRRLERNRKRDEPSLFDEGGSSDDRSN